MHQRVSGRQRSRIVAAIIGASLVSSTVGTVAQSPVPTPAPSVSPSASPVASAAPSFPGCVPVPPDSSANLVIISPSDCALVTDLLLVVIGTAPADSDVVRDVWFGFDDRVTADATGAWLLEVELSSGANELVFRLGDDRSTERVLRVWLGPLPSVAPITPVPTGPGGAWPALWDLWVCEAISELDDAGAHIAALGVAADDLDLDAVADEAEAAVNDAREARDALDAAGTWRPGRVVTRHLRAWAQAIIRAGNTYQVGAQMLDTAAIRRGTRLLRTAIDERLLAAAAAVELEESTGFSCD